MTDRPPDDELLARPIEIQKVDPDSLRHVYDGERWVPYGDIVSRLTAGADPTPVEPGTWPTPGQYIHQWNLMTEAERQVEAEVVLELKRDEYYRLIQPPRHA
jgi:hypothetical protein